MSLDTHSGSGGGGFATRQPQELSCPPALSAASRILHYCGSQSKSHCSSSAEGGVLYLKFKAAQHFLEDRVSISSQLVLSTSKGSFELGQGLAGMNTVLADCSSSERLLLVQPQHICMQTDLSWLPLPLSYTRGLIFFFPA